MKKLLPIFLLLTLSFAFSACGDSDEKEEKEEKEPFVWGGDWNDPSDPNYKSDGYNPIKGLWRNDSDRTNGIYFSEDFKAYRVYFFPDWGNMKTLFRDKYIINDKAYSLDPPDREFWRFKIEGNRFYTTPNLNDDNDWRAYTKVDE